jgi:hypothetical protein
MPLAITAADRTLASELGLFLVREPETDEDREDAAHLNATRVPETWLVKSAVTKCRLGLIRFTAVDCLYATKYGAAVQGIEETVADALRWIAPVIRHVRTGEYDGTEVIVRRFGSTFERPRALTECGAKSTGADYNPVAAKSELINGRSHEMCPACRAKLEAKGVVDLAHLSDRSGSSTPRQRDYVRRLLDEGARNGRPYLIEARPIDQMSSRGASATIDRLKALKDRGWKGDL